MSVIDDRLNDAEARLRLRMLTHYQDLMSGQEWYDRLLKELGPAPSSVTIKKHRQKLLAAARKAAGLE